MLCPHKRYTYSSAKDENDLFIVCESISAVGCKILYGTGYLEMVHNSCNKKEVYEEEMEVDSTQYDHFLLFSFKCKSSISVCLDTRAWMKNIFHQTDLIYNRS